MFWIPQLGRDNLQYLCTYEMYSHHSVLGISFAFCMDKWLQIWILITLKSTQNHWMQHGWHISVYMKLVRCTLINKSIFMLKSLGFIVIFGFPIIVRYEFVKIFETSISHSDIISNICWSKRWHLLKVPFIKEKWLLRTWWLTYKHAMYRYKLLLLKSLGVIYNII